MSILDTIAAQRRLDVALSKTTMPLRPILTDMITALDTQLGPPVNLHDVFSSSNMNINKSSSIVLAAEFKRASPSKGDIALHVDVAQQVTAYVRAGASVVSILTEPKWFKGSLQDMLKARKALVLLNNNVNNGFRIFRMN